MRGGSDFLRRSHGIYPSGCRKRISDLYGRDRGTASVKSKGGACPPGARCVFAQRGQERAPPGAGAKPIFFFLAKKKKTVLDAKRKRRGCYCQPRFSRPAARWDRNTPASRRHWAARRSSPTGRDVPTARAVAASVAAGAALSRQGAGPHHLLGSPSGGAVSEAD